MNSKTVSIDIHKMKCSSKSEGFLRIKLKFDKSYTLTTQFTNYNNGIYPYMQKLYNNHQFLYVEIIVQSQGDVQIAKKTVFYAQFIKSTVYRLQSNDQKQFSIIYIAEIKETQLSINFPEGIQSRGLIRRQTTLLESEQANQTSLNSYFNNLKHIGLLYRFPQRLDPFIYIHNTLLNILNWKNPMHTFLTGIILSILIFYFNQFLLIGSICLLVFRGKIYKIMEKIYKKSQNINDRVIIPNENIQFLQQSMNKYVDLYVYLQELFFSEDKSKLIAIIQICSINGIFLALFIIIFGMQLFLVISLWIGLSLASPFKNSFINILKMPVSLIINYQFNLFDKLSTKCGNAFINTIQQPTKIQFYYYHYERWWIIKEWMDQTKKYSDDEEQCYIEVRQKAPIGYRWIQEWKIDTSGNVDSFGYQYRNDFSKIFAGQKNVGAVVRRRKWKRCCVKLI